MDELNALANRDTTNDPFPRAAAHAVSDEDVDGEGGDPADGAAGADDGDDDAGDDRRQKRRRI